MPRPRAGERVLGPFPLWADRAKTIPWTGRSRIIHHHPGRLNDAGSAKTPFYFATRAEALTAKKTLEGLTEEATRTVAQAIPKFLEYLGDKEREGKTIEGYEWALGRMFPNADRIPLANLAKPEYCLILYTRVRKSPPQRRGRKPSSTAAAPAKAKTAPEEALATDSHRNILVMCRTFTRWCVRFPQRFIKHNGFEDVEGMGKRNRGKTKLTVDEARRFLVTCIVLANAGDQGAVAAMMTLLLGLRAAEVARRRVRDVDVDGRVLRLMMVKQLGQRTKTEEERAVAIPEILRPYLAALCQDKAATDWLWDHTRNGSGWATGKILHALSLAGQPLDFPTLAERSGVPFASVETIIYRLLKNKQVVRAGRGRYASAGPGAVGPAALMVRRQTPEGWEPSRVWVYQSVQRICRQAGTVVVTAHSMRGLQATLATIGGMSELLKQVAQTLGHDVRTMLAHYVDPRALAGETQARANDLLLAGLPHPPRSPGGSGEPGESKSNGGPPESSAAGNETRGIIPGVGRGGVAN